MWKTTINSTQTLDKEFGVPLGGEIAIIAIHIFTVVIGGLGNAMVIWATFKYNALSLDRITVLLVENIAIADVFIISWTYFWIPINHIAGRWILSSEMCFIMAIVQHVFYEAEKCFIILLGLYKLYMLKKPLSNSITTGRAKICVAVVWVFNSCWVPPLPFALTTVTYRPYIAYCMASLIREMDIACGIFGIITFFLIVATNIYILLIVISKAGTKSAKKATKTVCLVSCVFMFSYGPWVVYFGYGSAGSEPPPAVFLIGVTTMQLNLIANPLIYTFTNRSFGCFVRRRVCCFRFISSSILPKNSVSDPGTTKTANKQCNSDIITNIVLLPNNNGKESKHFAGRGTTSTHF